MEMNRQYATLSHIMPIVSAVAFLFGSYTIPGHEQAFAAWYMRVVAGLYMVWFLVGLTIKRPGELSAVVHYTVDELAPLGLFFVNEQIAHYLPVVLLIHFIHLVAAVQQRLVIARRLLIFLSCLLALSCFLLPLVHRLPDMYLNMIINFSIFLVVRGMATTQFHRDMVLRGMLDRLELLQLNNRQLEHDLRGLLHQLGSDSTPEQVRELGLLDRLQRAAELTNIHERQEIPIKQIAAKALGCVGADGVTVIGEGGGLVCTNLSQVAYLVGEFIENARQAGARRIELVQQEGTLTVGDDGGGFNPTDIREGFSTRPGGSGKTLAVILPGLSRLHGFTYEISSGAQGTRITLRFPAGEEIGMAQLTDDAVQRATGMGKGS